MSLDDAERSAVGRPNILLITTDEERYRLPRADGFALSARERLAENGTTFDHYYVASAMCSSSRSVIYTGRHMPNTEIYDNDNMPYVRPLDPSLGTLGTMMREVGYYCAYQGKWHLSNAYRAPGDTRSTEHALEPYGFSEFNDWGDLDGGAWAGLTVDPVIAGQAVKWLRNRAASVRAEQPWFLAVNFVNPHDVMSYDYGGRRAVTPPPNLAEAMVVRPPADIPLYRRTWDVEVPDSNHDDLTGAAPAVREYADVMRTMFGPVVDEQSWRLGLSFYLNCTRDVDRNIAVVLDALAASGQADRTVVVFTSDHGELAGSHGLRQKGNLVYDENFHVPLVIAHPDAPGGTRTDELASAVDLAPTVLELAGLDRDQIATRFPDLPGRSLVPALYGGSSGREGVLTAVEAITTLDAGFWRRLGDEGAGGIRSGELRPDWTKRGFLRGYTDRRHTFGRYFSPLEPNRPRTLDGLLADNDVVLYDRETDPDEQVNLAADPAHRDLVAELSGRLEALIDAEIGPDTRAWVPERPRLLGWPTWRGDAVPAGRSA
ncbi:sulfatase-like hydrolase/transferase [Actinomycetospora endophytica]|uniref:Sulfatase-like hydrolase/transferase n=1 Tax=Actinomycetospora endophytica TaxID=2291215 RepID=A0ABS8PHP0_9PSEU|nr:sulfatase-like hydrolase/transferase [Actinomycetospora endophytica]MCD2197792.1 sulfatase-like hydrolase/transferase [Actinomycetospora endophytica]